MDKDLNLNTSASLPDGTAASQRGGFGASASDVKRGYSSVGQSDERAENFYAANDGEPEYVDGVKAKSPGEVGGFVTRPQGWQR